MNKLDQFIVWLLSWVNRAIYVWGGQGETITSTGQIYRMETSNVNALRAIVLWIKRGRNAVCFDCSGLLVMMLLSMGLIKYDTTADGLLHMCEKITRAQLKRGDWVFRVRDGKAYHIGVVVDAELNVVEAMGRDDGVVKRGLDQHSIAGYWNQFGRPLIFKSEIEYVAPVVLPVASTPSGIAVTYQTHIQDKGWSEIAANGDTSGTVGKSLRVEAIKINHSGIQYRSLIQDIGWQEFVNSGEMAGTVGKSKRFEAVEIKLTGDDAKTHDILYQVHVQDIGWQDWVKNGETAGTIGKSLRVEAIRIKVAIK